MRGDLRQHRFCALAAFHATGQNIETAVFIQLERCRRSRRSDSRLDDQRQSLAAAQRTLFALRAIWVEPARIAP